MIFLFAFVCDATHEIFFKSLAQFVDIIKTSLNVRHTIILISESEMSTNE